MSVSENHPQVVEIGLPRFKRQAKAIMTLAWPAIMSRIGVMLLGVVDTIMVGLYATQELAYLNMGNGTIVMFILVTAIGMMIGTLVYTADAYGRDDFEAAGRVWRRTMPFAIFIGFLSMLVCSQGEFVFLLLGQEPAVAAEGGKVTMILGYGLVGYIIYVNGSFFLEGIERPKYSMYLMLVANGLNVLFNYLLIYGTYGFPEMGAEGAAWSSTILRLLLAVGVVSIILYAPALAKFKARQAVKEKWADWRQQRHSGYAAAISLGSEVAAFGVIPIFVGWLGTVQLAAWGIIFSFMSILFMIGAGFGIAASVRVGIAKSRFDNRDAALAGWTAVLIAAITIACLATIAAIFDTEIAAAYSRDTDVIYLTAPLIAYSAFAMILDSEQGILSNALRGYGESWVPMYIQSFTYIIVMIPLCYYLSIYLELGLMGLVHAIVIASLISIALQGGYFHLLTRRPNEALRA